MTQFFKWNMFFTSFLPLWISIVVTDLWTIGNRIGENCKQTFANNRLEIITVILLVGYTLFSMIYISRIISVQEKSPNKEHGRIVRAKRANKLSAEFLLAYILPMIAFDFSSMNNIVLFLIYFSVLSFLCVRNSNVYTNIFLELKGYKMYECDIERRIMNRTITDIDCLVISKNSLIQAIPRNLQYFDFENYIYIDIGAIQMSKKILLNAMDLIKNGNYKWNLYFVKIDRRNLNPYYVYKHTFRKPSYLLDYVVELSNSIEKFQIETLEEVSDYSGENSKTVCDKLCVNNELIKEQWENLQNSVCGAPREQIKGKYQGYILCGQAVEDGMSDIVIGKMGNPIISLERKNEKVFSHTAEGELDDVTDELCRLYLVADFCVIGSNLYAFNCKFETFFHLQKTLHRLKMKSIDQILDYKAFSDVSATRRLMERYPSPKTFLTLRTERVEKLKAEEKRKDLAVLLELKFENGYIVLENQEQANKLIKYLCYKLFQDKETDHLIEVKQVVNDHVV